MIDFDGSLFDLTSVHL